MDLYEAMEMRGGILGWTQFLIGIAVIVIGIVVAVQLFGGGASGRPGIRKWINTILFLGSFSAVLGLLIQILGIVEAIGAIIEAADISPELVLKGFRMSFFNPVVGLVTLLVSAVIWYALKWKLEAGQKSD